MIIKEVYEYFCVPLPIQQHMIDVASVAMMICEHWHSDPLDRNLVLTTALVHDLGNIIKVDFGVHCEFYNDNLSYWIDVKERMIRQYGKNCHDATLAMVQEIGLTSKVLEILDTMGIEKHVGEHLPYEVNIVDYADARVALHGVCSLIERLQDVQRRYCGKYSRLEGQERTMIWQDIHRIEQLIFNHCDIEAGDITHCSTRHYAEQLWNFELENVTIKNTM